MYQSNKHDVSKVSPPIPFYTLRTFKDEDITTLFFIAARDNKRITGVDEPALLSGTISGIVCYWDLVTMRVKYTLTAHDGKGILSVFLANDRIFSHGRNASVESWHFDGENWVTNCIFPAAEIGFCPASFFMLDSTLSLVIPHESNSLNLIDYDSGNAVSEIKLESHGMCMCLKVKIHKDTAYIFCGFEDGCVTVWNCNSRDEVSVLQIKNETIFCLDIDLEHRKRGVSGTPEGVLQTWNVSDDFQLSSYKQIPLTNCGASAVAIRPDGKILVSGGCEGNVNVFSWKSLKLLAVMFLDVKISCLTFSNCEDNIHKKKSVFGTGCKDGTIPLWSIY